MDQKLKELLTKINYSFSFEKELDNASLKKIIVNKDKSIWTFIISSSDILKSSTYFEIKKCLSDYCKVKVNLQIEVTNLPISSQFTDYYAYLEEEYPRFSTYRDRMVIDNDKYYLELYNDIEVSELEKDLNEINQLLKLAGFSNGLTLLINEEKRKEIQEEIEEERKVQIDENIINKITNNKSNVGFEKKDRLPMAKKKEQHEDVIIGGLIKEVPVKIKDIVGENDSVTIEGEIVKTDYFEPNSKNICIITLIVTDYIDSIYCKIFSKPGEDYDKLKSTLAVGKWFLFSGYTKKDNYMHNEIVLNARDINVSHKSIEKVKDLEPIKRVELHAHSMMSAMDGLVDAVALLKQAKSWGHSALAVTDHNAVQSFPEMYQALKKINKNLQEGEVPFKAIYGCELTLIDDTIDIVKRGKDDSLLDSTYVVFDFETTGFNAGGADSIIEIGAVKLYNGEIIDKFDELINPGKKLEKRITELTGITNEMLSDCPTEEESIKRFMDWVGDLPMVAHNAKFDVSFLEMAYKKYNLGEYNNTIIDTLELSRVLDNTYNRHSLSAIVKRYDVEFDEGSHHRGDYDAKATALVFHKMLKKLETNNIEKISDLEKLVDSNEIHKYGRSYHLNILVKNRVGLKNLFKLVSLANTKYLYKTPRILRSEIDNHREGLLIGSGCYLSEVFTEAKSKSDEELSNIINFYDYVEVQPPVCYDHLVQSGDFASISEVMGILKKIIRLTKDSGKIIVATGDVHHLKKEDKIYREIIINQKIPGGGRHPLARDNINNIPSMHFRTTTEMLEDFSFLEDDLLKQEIVVKNTNMIAEMIEEVEVIIETNGIPFSPKIENSKETVTKLVYDKAHEIYGENLPELIANRLEKELSGIIKGGFDVIYLIAQKLVKKSNDDGYLVCSRGSVGSSFVATMMGITEVNPLPAHYVCPACQWTSFVDDEGNDLANSYSSGYDLPDKFCPSCNIKLNKEGQDMPFATFLGFDADKVPDIDLNFSGEYQAKAHEYTKELFGVDNVYRAGTVGTVADKTAFGFVKGYFNDKNITNISGAEIERLAMGCTGVKRTTGQHPGGIVVIPDYMEVFDFTPFQYPADDPSSLWRTMHFQYHDLENDLLKLDILGHDDPTVLKMLGDLSGMDVTKLPMDDKRVLSLLVSPDELGVTEKEIMCKTGTLGLPELGTKFVLGLLEETKPKSFAELVKISGLSHGTDVWAGNASELIRKNTCEFKEVIGCRDDIMTYLSHNGLSAKDAFKIMEFVRKGKPKKEPEAWKDYETKMREAKVPEWYIDSCYKIQYMFPKAHACAYVMSALRIAWFKVYQPLWYYVAYFSVRTTDFDIETMMKGYDAIKRKIEELNDKGYEKNNKDEAILDSLMIALEATARGFKFSNLDINKSDSNKFVIIDDKTMMPPFRSIDGLGDTVSKTIVREREIRPFMDIEDLQRRGKLSTTLIDKLRSMGILSNMNESSQMTLF